MKKAFTLFLIIFLLTALIPLSVFFEKTEKKSGSELVTIFSSVIICETPYNHLQLQ